MLSTKFPPLPSPYSSPRDVNQTFESKKHCESSDFPAEASAQIESKEEVLSSEKDRHFDINNVPIWDNDDRKMQELMDRPEELTAKYFKGEISHQCIENTRRDKVMLIREEKSSVQTTATSSTILASNVVSETITIFPITNTKSSSDKGIDSATLRNSPQGTTQAADNPSQLALTVGHKKTETVSTQEKPLSQPNRPLFDSKFPSAFKVTNIKDAKDMLRIQIKKGWRWVSENFIDDDYSPGYCVEALDSKENKQVRLNRPFKDLQTGKYKDHCVNIDSDGAIKFHWRVTEHNSSNIKKADIVLSNQVFSNGLKKYYYVNNDGILMEGDCAANSTIQELKKYFDKNNLKDFQLSSNIVLKARQIPSLEEGDWVIMEGKTMRLVKTGSEMYAKLQNLNKHENHSDVLQGLTDDLSHISLKDTMPALYYEHFPSDFFNDSYAKLAGAYIRHLERLPKLHEAFNTFFDVKEKTKLFFDVKEKKEKIKSFSVTYNRKTRDYEKYLSVNLKKDPITKKELILTPAHLKLIRQALGINTEGYILTDQSTIANTIPFKKVLEMLTCFDPVKYEDCPWEVSLPIFGGKSFLLSRGQFDTTDKQLVVSQLNSDGDYVGSSYPDLAGPRSGTVKTIDAKIVSDVLNSPLSHSSVGRIDWAEVILEFLVCTQVVEAHCTPGYLKDSRVPGTGKLARAILQHHIHHPKFQVFTSFNFAKHQNRMFPMAPKGGTGTTRKAVQSLKRPSSFSHFDNGDVITTSIEAAPCRDMSTESDVEEIGEVWDSGEGRWD